ncbi:MAG: hypothetical protein AAGF11_44545 [Myxococcota bacterium]
MSLGRWSFVVAVAVGLSLGACDTEDPGPMESRIVVVEGGQATPFPGAEIPPRIGGDPPVQPGDQCSHLAQGSGAWCDCMGAAIDDLTDYYAACEDVLYGEGPIDITLYTWCQSLEQDFDDWWDAC